MNKITTLSLVCFLAQTVFAQWPLTESQKKEIQEINRETNVPPQMREQYKMVVYVNGTGGSKNLAYRTAVANKMLEEANYFADRLRLPTKRPIQITDIQNPVILSPWFSVIRLALERGSWPETIFSNRIYEVSIPRETRLQSLKFGAAGTIENINFKFYFSNGKLREVMRLDAPQTEYYSRRLNELVGKPSLINTNGAYQLATQWLAAVDVDMTALNKLKWAVNQLHYKAHGATNYITLPLYYVDFGNKHFPAQGNLHAYDEPLISVEVLGTSKELQDLEIKDLSYSRRPPLIVTNALDLIRAPNPPMKHLQPSSIDKTNSAPP